MEKLPNSVQEIADVIGRNQALHLVRNLPHYYSAGKHRRVVLYVPKKLKPDHRLVRILGYDGAMKLVRGFGGEILTPANCDYVERRERDAEIRELFAQGKTHQELADLFAMTRRHIQNITRTEKPYEDLRTAIAETGQD